MNKESTIKHPLHTHTHILGYLNKKKKEKERRNGIFTILFGSKQDIALNHFIVYTKCYFSRSILVHLSL